MLQEDEDIVSVLVNRANNPRFPLPSGTASSIEDQAKWAGGPFASHYSYANPDNLCEQ